MNFNAEPSTARRRFASPNRSLTVIMSLVQELMESEVWEEVTRDLVSADEGIPFLRAAVARMIAIQHANQYAVQNAPGRERGGRCLQHPLPRETYRTLVVCPHRMIKEWQGALAAAGMPVDSIREWTRRTSAAADHDSAEDHGVAAEDVDSDAAGDGRQQRLVALLTLATATADDRTVASDVRRAGRPAAGGGAVATPLRPIRPDGAVVLCTDSMARWCVPRPSPRWWRVVIDGTVDVRRTSQLLNCNQQERNGRAGVPPARHTWLLLPRIGTLTHGMERAALDLVYDPVEWNAPDVVDRQGVRVRRRLGIDTDDEQLARAQRMVTAAETASEFIQNAVLRHRSTAVRHRPTAIALLEGSRVLGLPAPPAPGPWQARLRALVAYADAYQTRRPDALVPALRHTSAAYWAGDGAEADVMRLAWTTGDPPGVVGYRDVFPLSQPGAQHAGWEALRHRGGDCPVCLTDAAASERAAAVSTACPHAVCCGCAVRMLQTNDDDEDLLLDGGPPRAAAPWYACPECRTVVSPGMGMFFVYDSELDAAAAAALDAVAEERVVDAVLRCNVDGDEWSAVTLPSTLRRLSGNMKLVGILRARATMRGRGGRRLLVITFYRETVLRVVRSFWWLATRVTHGAAQWSRDKEAMAPVVHVGTMDEVRHHNLSDFDAAVLVDEPPPHAPTHTAARASVAMDSLEEAVATLVDNGIPEDAVTLLRYRGTVEYPTARGRFTAAFLRCEVDSEEDEDEAE